MSQEKSDPIFDMYAQELTAGYERPYNLGFTPADIAKLIKPFTYYSYYSRGESGSSIHKVDVQRFIASGLGAFNQEQLQALANISYIAETVLGTPKELFVHGYAFFIKAAQNTDKLQGTFPLTFEDLMNLSVFQDSPRAGVLALEETAEFHVPLLCETARAFTAEFSAAASTKHSQGDAIYYDDTTYSRMIIAGMGLAYQHCEGLMDQCDQEVSALYRQDGKA